ncbi:MAG: hypothetical protein J3K34DRAFT_524504 [Monoraphidium minutum]|nr:MAG: hypothetical protein J3K34DRAFT_524504 [Monoraphidium minutum]
MRSTLLLLALLGCSLSSGAALQVEHRLLFLTTLGWTQTDFLEDVLNGYGVPYDIYRVTNEKNAKPVTPNDLKSLLWGADGSAKFSAYVMYPNLEGLGYLTRSEVMELWDYARRTGARAVKFNAWPTGLGFTPTPACTSKVFGLRFTPAAPMGNSGINRNALLESAGVYMCPGVAGKPLPTCSLWANDFVGAGIHPQCNTSVILELDPNPAAGAAHKGKTVGGALVDYEDGRQLMAFMVDCATWSPACLVLAHVAVSWALRGIYPGERRTVLQVHVDDVFLSTHLFGSSEDFRVAPADLKAHITWQKELTKKLPPGSTFKLALSWHGNGVLQAASQALRGVHSFKPLDMLDAGCTELPEYTELKCDCWLTPWGSCNKTEPEFCRNCTKDWPKPLGSFGWNRMPKPIDSDVMAWDADEFKADELFKYISENEDEVATEFEWIFHTFTHLIHENATYYEADRQIAMNKNFSKAGFLNLEGRPTMSTLGVITPSTSGMCNGDVLRALWDNGMRYSIGDVNFPHMLNQTNPHHMAYTTKAKNGFDGFALLPRQTCEIYVDVATRKQLEDQYNRVYLSQFGKSTTEQIVGRDARHLVGNHMLRMLKDPYVMHQANLHIDPAPASKGKSLVMSWVEEIAAELWRLTDWPLTSYGFDAHYLVFREREDRDACRFKYTLDVSNGSVAAITVSRGAGGGGPPECKAVLQVPDGVRLSAPAAAKAATSKVGSDPLTYKIPFGPKTPPVRLAAAGAEWPVPSEAAAAAAKAAVPPPPPRPAAPAAAPEGEDSEAEAPLAAALTATAAAAPTLPAAAPAAAATPTLPAAAPTLPAAAPAAPKRRRRRRAAKRTLRAALLRR